MLRAKESDIDTSDTLARAFHSTSRRPLTTMPLDVSPTATAEIRMGAGPAGRTPETVMQVRARSLDPSRAIFPI